MSIGVDVEHPVSYIHTQNGLVESFIRNIQVIVGISLLQMQLPTSYWGHVFFFFHATALISVRPFAYKKYLLLQLVFGYPPNVSHLCISRCAVYVPIAPHNVPKWDHNII